MDKKVSTEIVGEIKSILCWNSWVHIVIQTVCNEVKVEIPRLYCNPTKLKHKDVVKVKGVVADFDNDLKRTVFSKATVQKLFSKNAKNETLDFAGDFSLVGTILNAEQVDEEFYQIQFEVANSGEIYTLYMDKYHFEKAMEKYDFRRLIHCSGKMSVISYNKHFYDLPISHIKYYLTNIEYL